MNRLAERPAAAGAAVPLAELVEWQERFGLWAAVTERGGAPPWNLGLSTAEAAHQVTGRWRALRDRVRSAFPALHVAHQVHGATMLIHGSPRPGWHIHDDADAHATDEAGVLLAVTIADCVPVYLARRDGAACALLHCGWRGIAAGLLEAGITRLAGGTAPRDVVMHCGVAICGGCYEVGPEVVQALTGRRPAGPERVDLRQLLGARAAAAGVAEVTVSPWCTRCDAARFFSHRGGAGERQVALLGRPLAR